MHKFLFLLFCVGGWNCSKHKMIVISGETQGTTYLVKYFEEEIGRLVDKSEIDSVLMSLDLSLSTYNTKSIIYKLNEGKSIFLDEHLYQNFLLSKRFFTLTGGKFNPQITHFIKKSTKKSLDEIQNFGILKPSKRIPFSVQIPLSFNAIAQGYSVDIVSDYLKKWGAKNFIVSIGGETFTKGKNLAQEWRIGIENPFLQPDSNYVSIVSPKNQCIATSGIYRKKIKLGDSVVHHILDATTGLPAKNYLISASVATNSCFLADPLATCAFLLLPSEFDLLLQNFQEKIGYFLLFSDGKKIKNYHWEKMEN